MLPGEPQVIVPNAQPGCSRNLLPPRLRSTEPSPPRLVSVNSEPMSASFLATCCVYSHSTWSRSPLKTNLVFIFLSTILVNAKLPENMLWGHIASQAGQGWQVPVGKLGSSSEHRLPWIPYLPFLEPPSLEAGIISFFIIKTSRRVSSWPKGSPVGRYFNQVTQPC